MRILSRPYAVRGGAILLAVALVFAADAATKEWAATDLRPRGPRSLVAGHLSVRYRENAGGLFGALSDAPAQLRNALFLSSSALVGLGTAGLLWRRIRSGARGRLPTAGLTAVLAGTLGNLNCRLERGWVIDFVEWTVAGRWTWPVFNLADVSILIGLLFCLACAPNILRRAGEAAGDK